MKLLDFALKLNHPSIRIMLVHDRSGRVHLDGTADDLLDYSALDDFKVKRIGLVNETMVIYIH